MLLVCYSSISICIARSFLQPKNRAVATTLKYNHHSSYFGYFCECDLVFGSRSLVGDGQYACAEDVCVSHDFFLQSLNWYDFSLDLRVCFSMKMIVFW